MIELKTRRRVKVLVDSDKQTWELGWLTNALHPQALLPGFKIVLDSGNVVWGHDCFWEEVKTG